MILWLYQWGSGLMATRPGAICWVCSLQEQLLLSLPRTFSGKRFRYVTIMSRWKSFDVYLLTIAIPGHHTSDHPSLITVLYEKAMAS